MLSDNQIQEIEESCGVILILQNEDMALFMEKETEKQVMISFIEAVSNKIKEELSGYKPVKSDDGGYYWTTTWTTTDSSTNYTPDVVAYYKGDNTHG